MPIQSTLNSPDIDIQPSGPATPQLTDEEKLARMQARIEQLERLIPDVPASATSKATRKLEFGPAFTFDGEVKGSNDEEVEFFIKRIESVIRQNRRNRGVNDLDDEDKIIIAEQHLGKSCLRYYHNRIKEQEQFNTYNDFLGWMRSTYIRPNAIGRQRAKYRHIKQQEGLPLVRRLVFGA